MGEIDTNPIESVQTAISLFNEKGDQKKTRTTGSDECEKERELESVLKDLASYKVQLEAKEAAYMQALLKLEHSQKKVDELSILVENSEIERDRYADECRDTTTRRDELESEAKEMADQLLETAEIREQLLRVLEELKASKGELLCKEREVDSAREAELKALTQVEEMEKVLNEEREKSQEISKQVTELNEAILLLKAADIESQKENFTMLSEKDAEIEVAQMALVQAKEGLEDMEREVEMMQELENEFVFKSIFGDILELKLMEATEELILSQKSAANAIFELKLIREDLELKERKNLSQEALIEAFKMEVNEVKMELKSSSELASQLMVDVEILTGDLQKAKAEIDEMRSKETEAQVEIALLKSEIHKGRSTIAAAEAAEARAENTKSRLYLAVQLLAVEAESAKKENQMLKEAADEENDQENVSFENSSLIDELNIETEDRKDNSDAHISISKKDYESLIEKADRICMPEIENKHELENLRKELDAAMAKVAEFRNRAEQATFRAEMAEKAKAAIEGQLRKWREERQKKKAALVALKGAREEHASRNFNTSTDENPTPTYHQPLFKILNMKF
ncbi:WEB family [Parasponia andersonii]|uniref:WEB family n=1 Tax=Parasponia andersonii TaxID=3476 RepID=A0A2P5D6P8_PARAD|nr:WEB family [Parasponia andersonii]